MKGDCDNKKASLVSFDTSRFLFEDDRVRIEVPYCYRPDSNKSNTHIASTELCFIAMEMLHESGIHSSKESQLEALILIIILSLKHTELNTTEDILTYMNISCESCLLGFGIKLNNRDAKILISSRFHYYRTDEGVDQLSRQLVTLCEYAKAKGVFTSLNQHDIIFTTSQAPFANTYLAKMTQYWMIDIVKSKLPQKLAKVILYMQNKPLNIDNTPSIKDIEYDSTLIEILRSSFHKLLLTLKSTSYLPHLLALMLLLAWLDMPYGYYQFLRLSVTAYAAYSFIQHLRAQNKHRELLLILSAGIFLLYQPILKVPLTRDIWQWINLVSIAPLYITTPKHRKKYANTKK